MCGISGIVNVSGRLSRSALQHGVKSMADCIVHRGPDDSGAWVSEDGFCALSHRRLSIIDTSAAGRQPMMSVDEQAVITFNGELYNYSELKPELERRGRLFQTRTDTEVLIETIRTFGDDAYLRIDGMYAFGLYDIESKQLTLGRDPFGEKPLYYTYQNGYFAFASEIHCLTTLPGFDATLDEEAIAQFFIFQYIPSPRTIYRSVHKLPPGHFLRLQPNGSFEVRQYFRFEPATEPGAPLPIDDLADELEDILIRSTRRRLMSDVPLGAFLSGGVDSSAVVAIMAKALGQQVKTFSIGFEGTDETEHLYARDMAKHLGAQHHEKLLKPDALSLAQVIGRALDEPNADSSCLPTYLLSQFAREHVTVALSGDGGDEMFGGYGRYFVTLDDDRRFQAGDAALAGWNPGDAYFSCRILVFTDEDIKRLLGSVPPETAELLARLRSDINNSKMPLLARLRAVDMRTYLPGAVLAKVDRMSMQHSLEVRCPILSIEVARFAERLAPENCYSEGSGKLVFKRLAARYIPRPWIDRRKMGFGLPMQLWAKKEFLRQLRKLCVDRAALSQNWLGRENVERFVLRQEAPDTYSTYQAWTMLIFEIWLRTHMAGKQPALDGNSGRFTSKIKRALGWEDAVTHRAGQDGGVSLTDG